MKVSFIFFSFFFPPSFSPLQFLLEAFAYFKSLPKKIAQGQKWPICILKTQQRAKSGRERRGEGESLCVTDLKMI